MAVAVSKNFSKNDLQIDSEYMGKMLRITYHQGTANQSHKKMSPYPSEMATVKEIKPGTVHLGGGGGRISVNFRLVCAVKTLSLKIKKWG